MAPKKKKERLGLKKKPYERYREAFDTALHQYAGGAQDAITLSIRAAMHDSKFMQKQQERLWRYRQVSMFAIKSVELDLTDGSYPPKVKVRPDQGLTKAETFMQHLVEIGVVEQAEPRADGTPLYRLPPEDRSTWRGPQL